MVYFQIDGTAQRFAKRDIVGDGFFVLGIAGGGFNYYGHGFYSLFGFSLEIGAFVFKIKRSLQSLIGIVALLLAWSATDAQLPTPPNFGGGSSGDFWDYFRNALIAIFTVATVALLIMSVLGAGGGLLNALKKGREQGEWGHFAITVIATVLVLVLIIFGTVQIIQYINEI